MPKLVFHDSDGVDKTVQLGTDPVVIGRASDCQIQTHDAMVSRKHARITWDGRYWVEDLGSANGVFLGTEKVQRAPFRPGDVVTCGSLVVRMLPETRRPPDVVEAPRPRVATPPSVDATADARRRPSSEAEREWAEVKNTAASPALAGGGQSDQVSRSELRREIERREEAERALLKAEERVAAAESGRDEVAQLRRRVEQLQSDLRRAREGAPPAAPALDLAAAEEAVAVFNDALAGLKASLRSAVDEAELLSAPAASVRVVRESMRSAMDELERARAQLREMTRTLGMKA